MWQSFSSRFESLVFSCIKKNNNKKNQHLFSMRKLFPFSWIVLALHWLLCSCGFLFKSLLIFKVFFPPLFLFIYFGSANRSKDRQGHTTEHSNPVFLRLLVNLGCIRSSPLRMTCPAPPPPPQFLFFFFPRDWRLKISFRHSELSSGEVGLWHGVSSLV